MPETKKPKLTRQTLLRIGEGLRRHYDKLTEEELPIALRDQLNRLSMKEQLERIS